MKIVVAKVGGVTAAVGIEAENVTEAQDLKAAVEAAQILGDESPLSVFRLLSVLGYTDLEFVKEEAVKPEKTAEVEPEVPKAQPGRERLSHGVRSRRKGIA